MKEYLKQKQEEEKRLQKLADKERKQYLNDTKSTKQGDKQTNEKNI